MHDMADDEITQTYSFPITAGARAAEYLRKSVQPGDALTLRPEANGIAVYHLSRHIGYVSSPEVSRVVYPGVKYASWVSRIEHDDRHFPMALDIEIGIYGNDRHLKMINTTQSDRSGAPDMAAGSYFASPVMFRAHPLAFVLALLLTPAIIGVVILIVWAIVSRTTSLEIDHDTVRFETGVFSKDRRALSRKAIRTVRVTQTLLNRMLNVGSIEIFTAGDVPEIRAVSMYQPNEIRELLGK
jgi:membrane protein YdbS with pleckstrin-like domain